MSKPDDFSEEMGKKIKDENQKIADITQSLANKGLNIQVHPFSMLEMRVSAIIRLFIEKEIITGEEYAYRLVKTRREYLEQEVDKFNQKETNKLIVPKSGLIKPE